MPAIAGINLSTILDLAKGLTTSATVGVDKVFSPAGIDFKGVARWEERSGGISVGFPYITFSMRRPSQGSRLYKVMLKLFSPTLEVTAPTTVTGIQPQPTKAYELQSVIEVLLPERCTGAERIAHLSLLASLFHSVVAANDNVPTNNTGSPIVDAVLNLDPPY